MRFLTEKIQHLKIGWNEREMTETDFYRLCRRFKIKVVEMPLRTGGFYYRVMGRDFIAVDSRLRREKKLLVLFHELGHFLFHTPESGATANFHGVGRRTRVEREADVFALCALIPKQFIESKPLQELVDEAGFTPETVAERLSVFEHYGI
ncbi:MAG TPA: ImmA/IrrE family metallo-endopeptidase [Pyrinomonadaceae bacterium]|nr:ImmA/IrrE family metallo-endopeptidase [Pyrinomonadaceae bacterium]